LAININMPKSWSDALKEYNAGKNWVIPRKDSPEYKAVRKLMGSAGPAPAPAKGSKAPPSAPKVPATKSKAVAQKTVEDAPAEVKPKVKRVLVVRHPNGRKVRKDKGVKRAGAVVSVPDAPEPATKPKKAKVVPPVPESAPQPTKRTLKKSKPQDTGTIPMEEDEE
jgi:hypothetical protein